VDLFVVNLNIEIVFINKLVVK